MLPKNRRISRSYFPDIVKTGKRLNSPHFLLYIAPHPGADNLGNSKFSFSASKKNYKDAVVRNKLRRRGYSIIKNNIRGIQNGHFFFFSYKKGGEKLDFSELNEEIVKLLSNYTVLE